MAAKRQAQAICPNQAEHTPCPDSYISWHTWADEMGQTHHTIQCPGCGRWAIWAPGPEAAQAEDES